MILNFKGNIQKDVKRLKHKYTILKIKWILLFVLPILVVVLAYQVSKQFLKIKVSELSAKQSTGTTTGAAAGTAAGAAAGTAGAGAAAGAAAGTAAGKHGTANDSGVEQTLS